jgi:hypothetical protein
MPLCYLLVQMIVLLMVAMLVWCAVLLLARQRPKQSDATSRFLSPSVPIDAAGDSQAQSLRLLSVAQDLDEQCSQQG